jgi:hypothetical protein|tara:strand:- start:1155 stop:1514 length:360 start_codon:yes stop_codon:yes gene_type:complete
MVIKIRHLLLVVGFGIVCGVGIFFLYGGFDYENIYENANVWYKVSTDELNPGEIVALDMSRGYSECVGPYIYLLVKEVDTEEEVVLVFPGKGRWHAERADTTSMEIQKEFGKLEEYLRK